MQAAASPGWALHGDVLAFAGLRLRLQRIGLAHWRAGTTLRSWGAAALHGDGDQLLAPCGSDEALWLGAWLEDDAPAGPASIELTAASGRTALLALPPGFQISGLADAHGQQYPLTLAADGQALDLRLRLHAGRAQAQGRLRLCAPPAWAAATGRTPEPLTGPPPLPPRLG